MWYGDGSGLWTGWVPDYLYKRHCKICLRHDTDDPKRKGKQGGRRGFFRRLSWDAPSPTLVTSPTQMGTCICHPDEDRPLSVKEYARIQGFPDDWEFVGSTEQKYRMIGEAVPIDLARIIAETIMTHMS